MVGIADLKRKNSRRISSGSMRLRQCAYCVIFSFISRIFFFIALYCEIQMER